MLKLAKILKSTIFNRLRPICVLFFVLVTFTATLLLSACGKSDDKEPSTLSGSVVRLKHLVTAKQVGNSLAGYMPEYEIQGSGSFTNNGNYPETPHIYYYTVNFKKDIEGYVFAWRSINVQTGNAKETKDEILARFSDMEEVEDQRLGKAPYENVFALRYKNNVKDEWLYELYIRLAHINNQDNQIIILSGTFGPTSNPEHEAIAPEPMNSHDAVSTMLTLVEPIPN